MPPKRLVTRSSWWREVTLVLETDDIVLRAGDVVVDRGVIKPSYIRTGLLGVRETLQAALLTVGRVAGCDPVLRCTMPRTKRRLALHSERRLINLFAQH
jgi:hypothetical protein